MSDFFDAAETQAPAGREATLFARLPGFLAAIRDAVPGWTARLAAVDVAAVTSRAALAAIPVLRKPELMAAQAAEPPFGGFVDAGRLDGARYFMSPGPVWEPQGPGADPWGAARAFFAAGIRRGDLVHNALAYHMTPGGFILDEGARALGARVFPAGVGNTEQQVEAAAILRPDAYAGTPDFLKVLLDRAAEMGRDLSSIRKAIVSGGALFPLLRGEYRRRGVTVMQAYATADLGVIAYETAAGGEPLPGMVVNEDLIVEIVRPGTDDPVAPGEVGELVVTNFNPAYPLVRFGTGDLSAVLAGRCPTGRTNTRIKGWMGRADQTVKVRGMFVHPGQIAEVLRRHPEAGRARLVVEGETGEDRMTLKVEAASAPAGFDAALAASIRDVTKLRGEVVVVAPGSLPNDGKVIDDARSYR